MISLKDIADVCGVSISTVSKVLHGSHEISEETAERIMREAKRLGYIKGDGVNVQSSNPSGMVGITFDRNISLEDSDLYTNVAKGFRSKTEESENDMVIFKNYRDKHAKSLLARCAQIHLAGLTLVGEGFFRDDTIDYQCFQKLGTAIVTIGFYRTGISGVISDRYEGMLSLLRLAERLGHTDISLVCSNRSRDPFGDTEAIFRKAYYHLHQKEYDEHVFCCEQANDEQLFDILYRLGVRSPHSTCVICDGDWLSICAYDYVKSVKGNLIGDLSILCFEGEQRENAVHYHIAGTYINGREMGERAADMMLQAMNHRERYIPEYVKIAPILLVEDSIKDIAGLTSKMATKGRTGSFKRYISYDYAVKEQENSD